jgi:hypothetical protein
MKKSRIIILPSTSLFRFNIRLAKILTLVMAITMAAVSIVSILFRDQIYTSPTAQLTFFPSDLANLTLGVPIMLISIWLVHYGKLAGFLCWPGALFYVLYVYFPYLLAVPFNLLFLPYNILVAFSLYTLIFIIAGTNSGLIKQRLADRVPGRFSGGILFALAVLIIIRQITLIIVAHIKETPTDMHELAQWIDDLIVACPALIIVGRLLWNRKSLGYVTGAGLLLSYGILSINAIFVLVYHSVLSNTAVDISGIAALLIMAALCFIPFVIFIRGTKTRTE